MQQRKDAALRIARRFVTERGGDVAEIREVGNSWRWTAPDRREASIGWEA